MPSHHINRNAEDIKRELSVLLRDLKDPRVAGKLLTIMRVQLSGDGSTAKIYVSAMEGFAAAQEATKGLKSAAGFLRGELGRQLGLRKSPELRFIADNSIEEGTQILQKLDELTVKGNDDEAS
ncbi:MAG: 30S ribosome-binding factor RbfA [Oscillospiraceae bacterium]|nr:30S ribosome-binding factor RbfA [Oscillospiraceae bacterium]